MKSLETLLAIMLVAVPAMGASAAEYYFEYETDEGVLSYTDELRRVPGKYKTRAERHVAQGLFEYDRATLVKKGASTEAPISAFGESLLSEDQDPRVNDIDIDWSFASRPSYTPAPNQAGGTRLDLEVAEGVRMGIDTNGGEPIHIERRQRTDEDGNLLTNRAGISTENIVVRQGDRDLVYIEQP